MNKIIQFLKKNQVILFGIATFIIACVIGWLLFLEISDTLYSNPNITELWMWSD